MDNIGDAMALVGSTINPIIGFIMPVAFYWKVIQERNEKRTFDKIAMVLTVIIIVVASIASFISAVQNIVKPKDDSGDDQSC